jgi:hypothetical protein
VSSYASGYSDGYANALAGDPPYVEPTTEEERPLSAAVASMRDEIADAFNMLHWSCDNADHKQAYEALAKTLGYV